MKSYDQGYSTSVQTGRLIRRFYPFQQPSGCMDPCCSTSEPCLHGARCQASCMKNGLRFRCICAEGQDGERCENLARNCLFYSNSETSPQSQVRVIYAPDNTTYKTFCHAGSLYHYTLAFSLSVENFAVINGRPLSVDYPVLEDSFNWQKFRLGKQYKNCTSCQGRSP